ncbi:hypothetical protein JAAARDRAFT_108332, partial [Jaapia argillacea MUCL 33604]
IVLPPKTYTLTVKQLQIDLNIVQLIAQTHYLRGRAPVLKNPTLQLAWDFAKSPADHHCFVQMLRVTPGSFQFILQLIEDHPIFSRSSGAIFQTRSHRPQLPVQLQLAVTLYQMGRYGNGASIMDIARISSVSEGAKEVEKKWMEEHIGCVGWREGWMMYDGTIVVLFQKPGLNSDAYYTHKYNYGLNAQIGNAPSNL